MSAFIDKHQTLYTLHHFLSSFSTMKGLFFALYAIAVGITAIAALPSAGSSGQGVSKPLL